MAELLSMTLLSPEPASAAKPQAGLSNEGSTEPDQSFAATLAAEVNGKAPEKSAKPLTKTRQNNASDASDAKKLPASSGDATADIKNENTHTDLNNKSELKDEPLTSVETDNLQLSHEKGEAEQSHWLNLLEKAKSLHERLAKAEASEAETKITPEPQIDKIWPGMKDQPAEFKPAVRLQMDKEATTQGVIDLSKEPLLEQATEQPLTADELKALKLASLPDKNAVVKNDSADAASKKAEPVQKVLQDSQVGLSESLTEKAAAQSLAKVSRETSPSQNTHSAAVEKSVKEQVNSVKTESVVAETKDSAVVGTFNKTVLPPEAQALLKGSTVTVAQSGNEQSTETENLSTQTLTTDPKASVQAQSAAAVLSPAVQQTKATAAEAKTTTEDILKQMQAATISAEGKQGESSSSGESHQQSKADILLNVMEQQKVNNPVATEVNSFSSQLKSSLEKTNAAMTLTGREAVSEQSQKQVDQLGQKLNLIQPEASNQLKEKMLMMVKDKVHTAEIRLDPSELGSMQIKISLQQDQMSVQFMVQQGNARELMEQQMPKLKELLQQQGIELSQGSVQQQNQSSSGQEGGRRAAGGNSMGTESDGSEQGIDPAMVPTKNSDRVVDYYA